MNYLEKQKLKYDFFIIVTLAILFDVGIHFGFEAIILQEWRNANMDIWIGIFIGVLIMIFYQYLQKFLDKKFNGWVDQSISYRKGIAGEDKVFEKLKEILLEKHFIIPSVVVGDYGDADLVIVCSKGVIVIEVKNWSDEIFIKNGHVWRKRNNGKNWQLIERDPSSQALGQARNIDKMLKKNNLFMQPSIPIVVFINNVKWEGKPQTLVSQINYLNKTFEYIPEASDDYSDDIIKVIADKLQEHSMV